MNRFRSSFSTIPDVHPYYPSVENLQSAEEGIRRMSSHGSVSSLNSSSKPSVDDLVKLTEGNHGVKPSGGMRYNASMDSMNSMMSRYV